MRPNKKDFQSFGEFQEFCKDLGGEIVDLEMVNSRKTIKACIIPEEEG